MAKADWSREPATTPPATFTLTLNEAEVRALVAVAYSTVRGMIDVRQYNPDIYEVMDALLNAADRAGVNLELPS